MMHIESLKPETKNAPILSIPDAPFLYVPLTGEAQPLVKPGEQVKMYQKIGRAEKDNPRGCVHAPVSGVVKSIHKRALVSGKETLCIEIENDFLNEALPLIFSEYHQLTDEEITERIHQAGVLGEGGAEFPATLKYKTNEKKVETFIVNGAECEPYLTADYSVMAQQTEYFFEGIAIINTLLRPKEVVIGIEEHNRELMDCFAPFLQSEVYGNVRVQLVPNEYPQGGELQLTRAVTGKEIKRGQRPLEVGVVMNNVNTIYAIRQAVVENRPVTERVLTISGEKAHKRGNFLVKIGTPVEHLLAYAGYDKQHARIIMGGPMMGKRVTDYSVPVTKGTNGVLVRPKDFFKRLPCIGCGYCVDVCPARLMPLKYPEFYQSGHYLWMKEYNIDDCIECASCEYICPAEVPLMKSIFRGKEILKEMQDEK